MQKRINILSTLLIVVLVLGGMSTCSNESFKEGFEEGYETVEKQTTPYERGFEAGEKTGTAIRENLHIRSLHLHLVPKDIRAYPETILNTKTGEEAPMVLNQVGVRLRDTKNPLQWLTVALILLALAALVFAIINLVGFLSAVNSGNIFVKDNERRLNWMAVMFLFWYAAEWADQLIEYTFIKSSIALENYSITMDKASIYPLVIGITFLLFANIFALGRKMKEDQEFMV